MLNTSIFKISFLIILSTSLTSCDTNENQDSSNARIAVSMENNMLAKLTKENTGNFKWLNQPESFELENGILRIKAEKETDFFNNPEDLKKAATAPVLFHEIKGDFVAKALVKPDFSSMWNAAALMVHIDNDNWIKFAFENSDATGPSIVTVVTKNVSDDANGVRLKGQEQVWLKLLRKGNIYSMLWSLDGKGYKMARLCNMPESDSVKIGIEAQSPVGETATHEVAYFGVEKTTVKDSRKGE
ncbi:MAG: DUF1349 domain-containing protein [Bacteroidia bacterium]|nr:DUF1349 domain-containing protein [Bacteroidia bacterium]